MAFVSRLRQTLRVCATHPALRQRAVLWGGAVIVALVAIVFAHASDAAFSFFGHVHALLPFGRSWLAILLCGGVAGLLARAPANEPLSRG